MWWNPMEWADKKHIPWLIALVVFCLACFPANPLVFIGLVTTEFYPALFALGWVIWAIGMVLVMSPIIIFPRYGGVSRGKSFVNTTRLVDKGVYALVRHPQYLGGILSIFVTTLLWYPHWLFAVLGIIGSFIVYWSSRAEDRLLIERFGVDYSNYMRRVPGMNLVLGIVRIFKS
jgi:protein-S-isoprenylcysteine O-methyltransferase Ste14